MALSSTYQSTGLPLLSTLYEPATQALDQCSRAHGLVTAAYVPDHMA